MRSTESSVEAEALLTYELDPDESFTHAIVTAVANAADRSPVGLSTTDTDDREGGLTPLYEVIDPEALESMVTSQRTDRQEGDIVVSFVYHGFRVTVKSYGIIRIEPTEPDGEAGLH